MFDYLHAFFTACWKNATIPGKWKHVKIVSFWKKKGDRADCENSRGISLLNVAGKILARVLLRRLMLHLTETMFPKSQCGFRPGRSTLDMVFVARLLLEKSREQQWKISYAFVDLTKAFNTVNRPLLWDLLQKFGCPPTFVSLLVSFHDDMKASVSVGGATSDPFEVRVGVTQGCVLAPVLFNVYLVAVTLLYRKEIDLDDGVRIRYRFDGSLFNTRHQSHQYRFCL